MHLPPAGVGVETFEPVIALNCFNARTSPIPLMMPFLIKRNTFFSKDVLRFLCLVLDYFFVPLKTGGNLFIDFNIVFMTIFTSKLISIMSVLVIKCIH